MSRYVRPSGDGPEYTDVLKAQVERLTAELDAEKEISAALTFDREQLRAELETERCLSFREQVATLEAQLTETRDLAEHWAILAEQRRMELGECRKDAERWNLLPMFAEEYQINLMKLFDDINSAMEAKP